MSNRNDKKEIKAYKFTEADGEWAIILARDEYSAKQCYSEDFHITEKKIKKTRIRTINPSKKIKFVFSGKMVPISSLINLVRFFPRCVLDYTDTFDDMFEGAQNTL